MSEEKAPYRLPDWQGSPIDEQDQVELERLVSDLLRESKELVDMVGERAPLDAISVKADGVCAKAKRIDEFVELAWKAASGE